MKLPSAIIGILAGNSYVPIKLPSIYIQASIILSELEPSVDAFALTVISGIDYFIKNKEIITSSI